jgi:SIR2-like domain
VQAGPPARPSPLSASGSPVLPGGLTEDDWELLLGRIKAGSCTPFLGAGVSAGTLPLGSDVARKWASAYGYPLDDSHDLARVAQFLAVRMTDAMFPKEGICEELLSVAQPDFTRKDEPHGMLAELPLPVFMTTNYDDFMVTALELARKDPKREICRWNRSPALKEARPVLTQSLVPTAANPIVFHLHGHVSIPESIVLTEDDYLDFLVAISSEPKLLPHQIKKALAGASLLFIGYRLADWDFRVLHRGLVMAGEPSLRRLSVTVQLRPADPEREYLEKYFGAMNVRVYWGTAVEFTAELRRRWHAFDGG